MKIIDISRTIGTGAVTWPGSAPIDHALAAAIGPNTYQETRLNGWTTHLLTHVDAPAHIIAGAPTLDQLPLERFMGDVIVTEVSGDIITANDIPPRDTLRAKALFFKTRNSDIPTEAPFDPDYVYLTPEAARLCVERSVTLVGIDYYSPDPANSNEYPSHRALLEAGIPILECLLLKNIAPGHYHFAALPLKIKDADGSPVRALLY